MAFRRGSSFIAVLAIVAFALVSAGCAAGKSPDGGIVLGVKAAELPETASELAHKAAQFLPPPWGWIASAAATLLFGGAGATVINQRRAKQREDAAYDEGQARAYASLSHRS